MTKPTNHKPTKPNQTTKPKKQTKPTNKITAINFCAAMCSRKYLLGISGINLGRWNAKNQQEDEKRSCRHEGRQEKSQDAAKVGKRQELLELISCHYFLSRQNVIKSNIKFTLNDNQNLVKDEGRKRKAGTSKKMTKQEQPNKKLHWQHKKAGKPREKQHRKKQEAAEAQDKKL